MTREEAIYNLKALLTMGDFRDAYGDSICAEPYYEAVDMAVESLKNSERTEKSSQNVSNDDLISRKAAIDELRRDLPNDDLISRQEAIDALMAWEEDSFWDEECLKHRGEPFWVSPSDVIEQMPSAKPERKKGNWIKYPEQKNIYGGKCIECSECGEKYMVQYIEDEKYCRNCGADMRGEQE